MTLGDLITEIREEIKDTVSTYRISDVVIYNLINRETENVYNLIALSGRGWKITAKSYTLRTDAVASSNNQKYTLPTDFLAIDNLRYQDGDVWYPLLHKPDMRGDHSLDSEGVPRYYELEGDYLLIYPAPNEALTMEMYYIAKYTRVIVSATTLGVNDVFRTRIVDYCLWKLAIIENKDGTVIYGLYNTYRESKRDSMRLIPRGIKLVRKTFDAGNKS